MAGRNRGALAWSSDGDVCGTCRRPRQACTCRRRAPSATSDGVVRVGRQTKGRKGAGVTVVTGVPLAGAALAALAKSLKTRCGAGGTVRNGTIEIQGDHRDAIVAALQDRGWTVKRSGG